jgi:hypothetical protein
VKTSVRLVLSALVGNAASVAAFWLTSPRRQWEGAAERLKDVMGHPQVDELLSMVGFVRADPATRLGPIAHDSFCGELFDPAEGIRLRAAQVECPACREICTQDNVQADAQAWRVFGDDAVAHCFSPVPTQAPVEPEAAPPVS